MATAFLLAGCSGSDRSEPPTLSRLELSEGSLNPAFSPEISEYRVELGLLAQRVQVSAEATDTGATIHLDQERPVTGRLSEQVALELGDNLIELWVEDAKAEKRRYSVTVERRETPWREVSELTAREPVADGYFGDYLRASSRWLYVNSSRRGHLYRREQAGWTYDRASETLFSVDLEWMYEAAISDDALAIVAQPVGGPETLFAFVLEGDDWAAAGQFETGTQGTVRLLGDDLVFVTSSGISFFRREALEYRLVQTLPAPDEEIGFGERPTYFDAPGVALGEDLLVVGAPLDSSPATGIDGAPDQDCSSTGESCAFRSGAVFVYERSSGVWDQTAYLKPPTAVEQLQFGATAALDGDLIVVGCPREGGSLRGASNDLTAVACTEEGDDCVPESGAVYVYERDEEKWRQRAMLKASVTHPYDYFGDTLLLSGDVLLVGAPGQDSAAGEGLDDVSQEDSGGVFAFVRGPDGFSELGLFKLDDPSVPFPFPATLVASSSSLLVASNQAPFQELGGETLANAGRVYYLY